MVAPVINARSEERPEIPRSHDQISVQEHMRKKKFVAVLAELGTVLMTDMTNYKKKNGYY